MQDMLTPADIEAKAVEMGLTMGEVCRRAGIAHSTFTRWKAGRTEPTLDVYRKLRDVVAAADKTETPWQGARPMPDTTFPAGRYGMAESQAPLLMPPVSRNREMMMAIGDEADALEIFARVLRELPAAEARADRLLRRYNA